jgi:hypothetical protein
MALSFIGVAARYMEVSGHGSSHGYMGETFTVGNVLRPGFFNIMEKDDPAGLGISWHSRSR